MRFGRPWAMKYNSLHDVICLQYFILAVQGQKGDGYPVQSGNESSRTGLRPPGPPGTPGLPGQKVNDNCD